MIAALPALLLYLLIALFEITGWFAVWAWLRLGRSPLWLLPAAVCLATFAILLTRVEADFAGRAFAAYGGVYIAASLSWLILVERTLPDRWDLLGGTICVVGAMVILLPPR